jgi:hypothetical protein
MNRPTLPVAGWALDQRWRLTCKRNEPPVYRTAASTSPTGPGRAGPAYASGRRRAFPADERSAIAFDDA